MTITDKEQGVNMSQEFKPDYAVLPGESIKEMIEYMGLTQKDFALRLEISEQSLIRILQGKQPITHETALKLELVTGVSNEFWMAREANYQKHLARLEEEKNIDQNKEFLERFPIKELVKRNIIKASKDVAELKNEILRFFKVGSIEAFYNVLDQNNVAARSSKAYPTEAVNAITYLHLGMKKAEDMALDEYSHKKLDMAIEKLRELTNKEPESFVHNTREILAEAGIALVYEPRFKGMHLNAVCKWISPKNGKAIIVMNDKGKSEDIFWFSLFHELGHIRLHGKKQMFLNYGKKDEQLEKEADDFAANKLLPNMEFDKNAKVDEDMIHEIANNAGISAGIVAGRYAHQTGDYRKFRHMIRKLEIS